MSQLSIPSMSDSGLINIGQANPDGYNIKIIVDPERYDSLPIRVYNMLQHLSIAKLGITVEDYTRMWRTLLLMRLQDIYRRTCNVCPDHYIRMYRTVLVPAPLGDMLTLLGQYTIPGNGVTLKPVPPSRKSPTQDWWTVDPAPAVLEAWMNIHSVMEYRYMMREFPSPNDIEDKPILALSRVVTENGFLQIKAATNKFTPVDAYIRLVHDDLWTLPEEIGAHNNVGVHQDQANLIDAYIAGYTKPATLRYNN